MRVLSKHERCALIEVGDPFEGPVPDATFDELSKLGWGYWGNDGFWHVTATGKKALELDTLAREVSAS
jgi:hypothetical protein